MEAAKKKIVLQVVVFIVAFAIAFLGTKYIMSSFKSNNPDLEKAVTDLNRTCPHLIDSETRLDSASSVDNTFRYHYSLVNFSKGDPKLDVENVKNAIRSSAQRNFDTNPQLKDFRKKNVSLQYNYKDKTGKDLFDFTIKANNK